MDKVRPSSVKASKRAARERRTEVRQTSILRLALLDAEGATQLCRVTNVSTHGLQATVFGAVRVGGFVTIRVPDEIALTGSIVWVKGRSVGIKLAEPLPQSALLRFGRDDHSSSKRRRLPRVRIAASGRLRSGGRSYPVEMLDISPAGAMVRTASEIPALGPVVLDMPGLPKTAGQIRWVEGSRAGLLFAEAVPLQTLTDWIHGLCHAMVSELSSVNGAIMEDHTSIAL
nr:PilZ domain-containing protein [Sphingomonas sp.]